MLKVILESPKRYRAECIDKKIPRKETKALNFGSAIHLAILEPGEFRNRYRVEARHVRRNTTAYKDWKLETLMERADAILLSHEEMQDLEGMIRRSGCWATPRPPPCFRQGHSLSGRSTR